MAWGCVVSGGISTRWLGMDVVVVFIVVVNFCVANSMIVLIVLYPHTHKPSPSCQSNMIGTKYIQVAMWMRGLYWQCYY